MKRLILISALVAAVNFSFAQKLQKGNLVGLHIMNLTLKPGVTKEQFKTFYINEVIPAYESAYAGTKGFLIEGRRGESEGKLGIVWYFETEQDRDKFFTKDGTSEAGKMAAEKTKDVDKKLDELGTSTDVFTDWIVL